MEGKIKKNDMIKHGEKITYGCLRHYTMIGSNTKECDNGLWTNDDPVCKGRLVRLINNSNIHVELYTFLNLAHNCYSSKLTAEIIKRF